MKISLFYEEGTAVKLFISETEQREIQGIGHKLPVKFLEFWSVSCRLCQ